MENKFINRYNMFCRCLENLKKSQKADPEADFVLEGTVQNFNLAFDIWNSRIKALRSKKTLAKTYHTWYDNTKQTKEECALYAGKNKRDGQYSD